MSSVGWAKTRGINDGVVSDKFFPGSPKSIIYYDDGNPDTDDTYSLEAQALTISPTDFTDNNIYELLVSMLGKGPSVISNRSFTSFIVMNVPDGDTLNNTDWTGNCHGGKLGDYDGDGLSDWMEFNVTYTNPFLSDTDNDGYSDYHEILYSSDPNNYTSFGGNIPPNQPLTPSPVNNTDYLNVYNVSLNCTVSDPDGDALDVHYYWGNGTSIGTITDVVNNTTASLFLPDYWNRSSLGYDDLTWLLHDTTYEWYSVCDDGIETNQSPTWNFHTSKAWDLNADRTVNYLDLSLFVSHYGLRVIPPGDNSWDINDDTYTNYLDVSLLVNHYGEEY